MRQTGVAGGIPESGVHKDFGSGGEVRDLLAERFDLSRAIGTQHMRSLDRNPGIPASVNRSSRLNPAARIRIRTLARSYGGFRDIDIGEPLRSSVFFESESKHR